MEDIDENDIEVFDILESSDEETKSSQPFFRFLRGKIKKLKTSLPYFIYDKCSKIRTITPEPSGERARKEEENLEIKNWWNYVRAQAESQEIKLTLDICIKCLESYSRNNIACKTLPSDHPIWEKVSNPVPREGISGLEWNNLFERWKMDLGALINSPEFKLIQLAKCDIKEMPEWIKQPTKDLFENDKDFSIAIDFYTKLVTEPETFTLDGEIPDLDYQDLVKHYLERHDKNYKPFQLNQEEKNFYKPEFNKPRAIYLWCTQERWEKYYEESIAKVRKSKKMFGVVKDVKLFKNSITYQKCPPEQRPQTPTFEPLGNPVTAKAELNEWKVAISNEVPRKFRPASIVRDDDIKEVMESKLYKEYCVLRSTPQYQMTKIAPKKQIFTLEEWERELEDWKSKLAAEINRVKSDERYSSTIRYDPKDDKARRLEPYQARIKKFKKLDCYINCPKRPPTPDIERISIEKIDSKIKEWKKNIYQCFPRTELPLNVIKHEDLSNFNESKLGKRYNKFLVNHSPIERVYLKKGQCTIGEWDKDFAAYVNDVQKVCQNVEEDPSPAKRSRRDNPNYKNSFSYRLADFTHSPVYEKCKDRPPTPRFNDFEDPQEALKKLHNWMEVLSEKSTREDCPLFYVIEKDLATLKRSQLYKDYQKAVQCKSVKEFRINWSLSIDLRYKANEKEIKSLGEWDKCLDEYVTNLKERIQNQIQLQLPKPAQLSSNGVLDMPLPRPSGSSAPNVILDLVLPKPTCKARASDDLRNIPMEIESQDDDILETKREPI